MQQPPEGSPQPPQQPYYPPQQYGQPPYEGRPQPPQQPYYPPQQPYGPPYPQQPMYQPPPPKKRSRAWLWIVLGVLAVLLLGCIGIVALVTSAAKTGTSTIATVIATTVPTTTTVANTPSGQQNWTTTHTFTGSGSKKTGVFSVPSDWRINWTCKPSSFTGNQYNLVIFVYNSDNTLADSGVNTICKEGNTSDSTEIHTSGQVYLNIISEGDWTIQVQEPK